MSATTTRARDVRFLTVEPGRISLHGVVLTDAEYATLRAIAERMKRCPDLRNPAGSSTELRRESEVSSTALGALEC
jgi:hypothetical protein